MLENREHRDHIKTLVLEGQRVVAMDIKADEASLVPSAFRVQSLIDNLIQTVLLAKLRMEQEVGI
jgi:hypothetical protein